MTSYSTTSFGGMIAFTSGVLIAGGTVLMTSDGEERAAIPSVHPASTTSSKSTLIRRVPNELLVKRFVIKSFGLGSLFLGSYFLAPTFLRQAWIHDINDPTFYVKLALGSLVMLAVS